MTVAVVGAGIAGVACARALSAAGRQVRVLDRGRAPGGRMSSRTLHGRAVDLGASYLTASDERFQAVVDDWCARGVARPWTDTFLTWSAAGRGQAKQGPVRYGAPRGLRSLVDDLAQGLDVERGHVAEHVGPGPVVDGERYEAVVLAMPDPQALRLLDPAEPVAALVADRVWEPAYALAAGYAARSWDFDGVFVDDTVLTWVADDGARRGDGAPVLVAHSTGPFAQQHLAEPEGAEAPMALALQGLLGLPAPGWTHVHRWTYSRPSGPRDEPYGLADGVGLCGDGWGASKVQAAWLSGTLLGEALAS